MYHPSVPLYAQLLRAIGCSCAIIFVPGGARGVLLKSNVPCNCAYTDNLGLMREGRRRFNVMIAWGDIRHQRWREEKYFQSLNQKWSDFRKSEFPALQYFSYECCGELAGIFHCSCSWTFWKTLRIHYLENEVWALSHVIVEAYVFSCMLPITYYLSFIINTLHGLWWNHNRTQS